MDNSRDREDKSMGKDAAVVEKHMNSFLDECLTEDKSFVKHKNTYKKKHKHKNRPSTSLFSKKRKSSGNGLLLASRVGRGFRAESAMGINKSMSKEKYRPVSAFATHYVKYKAKGKKHSKMTNSKINVKTRNTRNHPNV